MKACVVKRITSEPGLIFESRSFGADCWTHDLEKLVGLADLEAVFGADLAVNQLLADNWDVVNEWEERSRYSQWSEAAARDLFTAINHPQQGVLQWVRIHW